MAKNKELKQLKSTLKERLQTDQNQLEALLSKISKVVQKLTKSDQPLSHLASAVVLGFLLILIELIVSLITNEIGAANFLAPIRIMAWTILFLTITTLLIFINYMHSLTQMIEHYIIDSITTIEDLENLQNWIALAYHKILPRLIALIIGILSVFVLIATGLTTIAQENPINLGSNFVFFFCSLIIGLIMFYIPLILLLPIYLSRYTYDLYASNPSQSEIVHRIYTTLNQFLYISALYSAMGTFVAVSANTVSSTNLVSLITLSWGTIFFIFILNQGVLRKIITEAKWQKLRQIQSEIIQIESKQKLNQKDTIESLNRLADFHNRIYNTPNSILNFKTGLNFINSLLLPLLAFILANFG